MNLFAYGTLMWPEVLESVIGRSLSGTPAILRDHLRLRIKGEHYPAVIPRAGHSVPGILYQGLGDADFRQLDRFEGEEYNRLMKPIGAVEAQVYVFGERYRHLLDDQAWWPEQMTPAQLADFCREYKGWWRN